MFKKAHLWMVAAVGMIVTTSAPVFADASKYFSKDSEFVFSVNLRQIMNSKLVKDYKVQEMIEGMLQNNEQFQELQRVLGINLLNDVETITAAGAVGERKPKDSVMVIEGKFNQGKFDEAAAKAMKEFPDVVAKHRLQGSDIFEITPPGEEERIYLTMVNKGTMLFAQTKDGIGKALANKGQNDLNKQVRSLIGTLGAKNSLGIVATSKGLIKAAQQNPRAALFAQQLNNIDGFGASLTVGKEVQFQFGVDTGSVQSARELNQQAIFGLIALRNKVQQMAQNDFRFKTLIPVTNSLKASVQGTNVIIRGLVTKAAIDEAVKNIPNFQP